MTSASLYEFGDFRFDPESHRLSRRDGTTVPLTPRVFDTLLFLVQHPGQVLDKERLMEAIWPDSIVEENNLAQCISTLRRVFGDTPERHLFIVTVPGRGYRFAASVNVRADTGDKAESSPKELQLSPAQQGETVPDRVLEPELPAATFFGWRVGVGVLLVIALVSAGFFFSHRRKPEPAASTSALPPKSIAVLPFENLSEDKRNAYFADGVQDEILTDLAKIADLRVISRMSVLPYKDKAKRNLSEIAQELGVAHLLEGSVQRANNRVRVTAQLIDTRSRTHEWAETYDRDLADVFAIQSEIAAAIAQQLRAKISPNEKVAMTTAPTTDLAANALYVRARSLGHNGTPEETLEAIHLLEEAGMRDPHFVLAFCLLSRLQLVLFYGGYDHTPSRRELANVAIQNALRTQPTAGEVHLALARYAYYGFRDYDRARAEVELARDSLPNDAEVYFLSVGLDRRQGRWPDAIRNAARAVELDPRNSEYLILAAGIYQGLRRYPESAPLMERAYRFSPDDLLVRVLRALQPLAERADPQPLAAELSAIIERDPRDEKRVADDLFRCALARRDPAGAARAIAAMPAEGIVGGAFLVPREWFAGLAARTFHHADAAQTAFVAARERVEKLTANQPDYAQAWSLLGKIDAALGRKEEAIQEGRRACELLPVSKDALEGAIFITDLATTYAWTGEKDLALAQLATSAQTPLGVTYGGLKLDPQWDSLRDDPRFDKIVASLAPRE